MKKEKKKCRSDTDSRVTCYKYQFRWTFAIYTRYRSVLLMSRESLYLRDEFHLESLEMAKAPRIEIEKKGKKGNKRDRQAGNVPPTVYDPLSGCGAAHRQTIKPPSSHGKSHTFFFYIFPFLPRKSMHFAK